MDMEKFYKLVDDYIVSVLKTTQANTYSAEKLARLEGEDRHDFYTEVRERIEDIIEVIKNKEI